MAYLFDVHSRGTHQRRDQAFRTNGSADDSSTGR